MNTQTIIKNHFCKCCNPINPAETGDCNTCNYKDNCSVLACIRQIEEEVVPNIIVSR